MKLLLLMVLGAALTATTLAVSSRLSATATSPSAAQRESFLVLPPATRAGQTTQWGHIKSLKRKGSHFEMRFDPGLMLHGVTAERASLEDRGTSEITNDYYVREESHRLLTYVVPANAHVTVLVRTRKGVTQITAAELAQIVAGKNPKHRSLLEPKTGFWIRIGTKYPNPALALDQQYQP